MSLQVFSPGKGLTAIMTLRISSSVKDLTTIISAAGKPGQPRTTHAFQALTASVLETPRHRICHGVGCCNAWSMMENTLLCGGRMNVS